MKCPNCDGKGVVHVRNIHAICGKCKGFGWIDEPQKKPQTNFEWLTESPERLANWIERILTESGCEVTQFSEMWIGWLKQPHNNE